MSLDDELALIGLQEKRLRFERFDPAVAWEVGRALRQAADSRGAGMAIDISTHGHLLFHCATGNATPDNTEWVRRKRNLTLRFFRASYAIGLELKRDGRTLESRYGLGPDFMAHGGSFPIWAAGTCIGAITVSGLPQREDHDLLTRTLAAWLRVDGPLLPPPTE